MMPETLSETLHLSLSERWRPEQVAKAILNARGAEYETPQRALLRKAQPRYGWSSMGTGFAEAVDMRKQCATAALLFGVKEPRPAPKNVRVFIDKLRERMHATKGLDFKADRRNRRGRRVLRLPKSHRAYNKRFRMLARLESKYETWGDVTELRELARVAKSRLAFRIPAAAMREPETACFLAWMTARLNVRSMFTFGKQDRAFDEIAKMLLSRVPKRGGWAAIALVHPAPEVIERLTDARKGRLLAEWFTVMGRAATVLERVAKRDKPDLESLIVRRGNDSSTWNEAAGAYNKARDGWMSTLYALGMGDALESLAPGKAMRLMAADVAWGHRTHGEGLDPDTRVWGLLPKPWEVLSGKRRCRRATIEAACEKVGTPHGGWVRPRAQRAVAYRPTPELVHGVVCVDPSLAQLLKRAGYFGGHGHRAKTGVVVDRPFDGEKVGASWPVSAEAVDE
jgi:hypothetical protein